MKISKMPRTRRSLTDADLAMEEDLGSLKSDSPETVSCVVCYEPFVNPNYDTKAPKWQSSVSRVFYKALSIPPIFNDEDEEETILSLPYCPGCHTKMSVMYSLYSQLETIQSQYATLRNDIAFSVVESMGKSNGNGAVDFIRRQVYDRWKEYHAQESARGDYRSCYGLDAIIPGGLVGMSEVNFDEDEELAPIKLSNLKSPGRDDEVFGDQNLDIVPNGGPKTVLKDVAVAEKSINGFVDDEDFGIKSGTIKRRKKSISKKTQSVPVSPGRRAKPIPSSRKPAAKPVKRAPRVSLRFKSEMVSPTANPKASGELSPSLLKENLDISTVVVEDIKPMLKRRIPDGFGSPSKVGRGRAGIKRGAIMKRERAEEEADQIVQDELEQLLVPAAIKREPIVEVYEFTENEPESRDSSNAESAFPCHVCPKGFTNAIGLTQHISMVHPSERELQCKSCKIGFSGQLTYKRHMKKSHPLEELSEPATTPAPVLKEKHPCPICKKVFLKKTTMIIHKKSHVVKRKATINGSALKKGETPSAPVLKKQKSRKIATRASPGPPSLEAEGTVSRPEECNMCDRKFQYPHLLRMHMVTHTKKSEKTAKPRKSQPATPKRSEELPMEQDIPAADEAKETPNGVQKEEETSTVAAGVD